MTTATAAGEELLGGAIPESTAAVQVLGVTSFDFTLQTRGLTFFTWFASLGC